MTSVVRKLLRGSRGVWELARRPGALAALVLTSASLACGPRPPAQVCGATIWAQPVYSDSQLAVIGTWDDWAEPVSLEPVPEEPGWWRVTLDEVPPGDHGYLVVDAGVPRLDPHNPLTRFSRRDGEEVEVSLAVVTDCAQPVLRVESFAPAADGSLEGQAVFYTGEGRAPLDPDSVEISARGAVELTTVDPETGRVDFRVASASQGKHSVSITASDLDGNATAAARASTWVQPVAERWRDSLIYHVMVDRYRGDGGATLAEPSDMGARAGGTLDGVRAEVERGTLSAMGVSTIWLSPVYLNPDPALPGRDDDYLYEGYHGYWVQDSRAVDPRIGGERALDELVAAAHERGIRVLLDIVPNHIYEDNPRYRQPKEPGWFNEPPPGGPCVCGIDGCSWEEFIMTCWFTDYLPDLRFEHPGVMREAVDDALWWDRRFDVDGVRIDAVFMMPRGATRWIAHALREDEWTETPDVALGEAFTGPGDSAIDALRYYLGPDGLDSVFDFPFMWAVRDVVAHDSPAGFAALEDTLLDNEAALEGSGSVLSTIIGNHDTSRFISEVVGDVSDDPWAAPSVQPSDPEAYARQRIALALLLTMPGVPVLYYGDELGLAGGRDPDCRRVMPEVPGALDATRLELLTLVERLGSFRRCSAALRRGARAAVVVEDDIYAFVRDAGEEGGPVLVAVSRAPTPQTIALPAGALPAGVYVDVLTGETLDLSVGGAPPEWTLPGFAVSVLTRADDPCAQ